MYCDFFSSTYIEGKARYIDNLCIELQERKDYLKKQTVETVYFGGGTPSLLPASDFDKIFSKIKELFTVDWQNAEITLEANPDDLSEEYLKSIRHLPFNRISIGIQSFHDEELKFLNRRHNVQAAIQAVELCKLHGYKNISIDLMYGLPQQSLSDWISTIEGAIKLDVQHISAYHLIYEEGTRLHQLLSCNSISPVDEELSNQMFEVLIKMLTDAGFEQYEISNFARPGFYSRHNSSYWKGVHYLGIGAAAHSYNGLSRQWNKNVLKESYLNYEPEIELIDEKTAFNDFIITRLRTMQGIDLDELENSFGKDNREYILKQSGKYLNNDLLELVNHYLRLTRKGIFVSDGIMSDLMK